MPKTWKKVLQTTLKSSMIVFTSIATVSILNYVFTILVGRILGPKDYSIVATLLALSLIINPIIVACTDFFTKFTATYGAAKEHGKIRILFHRALQSEAALGLITISLIWLTADIASDLLRIPRFYIMLFAFVVGFNFPRTINLGIIQGLQHFRVYAITIISEVMIKLSIVAFFIYQGLTIARTITAILASTLAVSIITGSIINNYIRKDQENPEQPKKINTKESWPKHIHAFLFISIGIALLIDVDMLFVKHYINAEQAGQYAAIMTMSRIIYYSSLPFGIVLFPAMIAARKKEPGSERSTFEHGSIVIMAFAGTIAVMLFSFAEYVLSAFFGPSYTDIAHYLRLTVITVLGWVVVTTLSAYFMTIEKYMFSVVIFIIAIAQIVGIFAFHDSLQQIMYVLMAGSILAAMCMVSLYVRGRIFDKKVSKFTHPMIHQSK